MSFRDFVSSRRYRTQIHAWWAKLRNSRPPENPSRRHIDKLVRKLRNPRHADLARAHLEKLGELAAPSLLEALHAGDFPMETGDVHESPYEVVIELLAETSPGELTEHLIPLVANAPAKLRRSMALQLSACGREAALPILERCLADPDEYVRSYVVMGTMRAVDGARATDRFRSQMYASLLQEVEKPWGPAGNESAAALLKLDREKAALDLQSPRFLSIDNPAVANLLEACTQAGIALPADRVIDTFNKAMAEVERSGDQPTRFPSIVCAAVNALPPAAGKASEPLIARALGSSAESIREAACEAACALAGIRDPVAVVLNRLKESLDPNKLSDAQRVVYRAFWFDAEVCNGGILQFFVNDHAGCVADTLRSLQALQHAEAQALLGEAVRLAGQQVFDPDCERRMSAFEGRFDELTAALRSFEDAYFKTSSRLRQQLHLYAVANRDEFAEPRSA